MKKVLSETHGALISLPWLVAKDYGFFEAEGIDMEFVDTPVSGIVAHTQAPERVNPVLAHTPFDDGRVSIYRA